ncbi:MULTISPECIES: PIN domain-containing protein [unclassified Streptomyces]|uniref:type II toxin-antitoxin system VapC family toxin n=1 Tax=unclassified Streptomyces TaxID=2593676 RepID=UPI00158742DC|nr:MULTISPECIES: PIN domain-containing protein [unclassified Streptomyces]NUV68939.1 PIN domain-containing protein [Streptomyces sp. CAI-121]NUW04483.1 PIN domain-containing protein [Streptomyces sp. CAI 127]NUW15198.1 PIN domain-containing protein [Streptomyces sp. CAI-68]
MPEITYVLDCEAVSRAALGDPEMKGRLKDAHRAGIRVVTSAMTLVEAYHSKIRRPVWDWAMSGIVVEPVTKNIADEAIRLLREAGLHGHKYAIDAVLAAIANRQRGQTALFTSDVDDMGKLCGKKILLRAL